jgi:non-heme chloroperoxidase
MVKSDKNPGGTPIEVFDKIREGTAKNRAQFYQDITLPFYGYNRPEPLFLRAFGTTGGVRE